MPWQYYFLDNGYFMYILPFVLLALYAQFKVKSTYTRYSKVPNQVGLTGQQVAREVLDRNGLQDVEIKAVRGQLSDHYDPRKKVVALSEGVYGSTSVSAASIAAHECGHAIQHAKGYVPLKIRSALAPVVALTSNFVWVLIFMGFVIDGMENLITVGIWFFAGAVAFQVITLPVEFNASSRAIKQLQDGLISPNEVRGAKSVLSAAALTYVAATLTAVAQLMRLLAVTQNKRRD